MYPDPLRGTMDGTLIPTWQALMAYSPLISKMPIDVKNTLDALQELIPIRFYRSRVDTYLLWYRKGRDTGLITTEDHFKIIREMIDGCGGM